MSNAVDDQRRTSPPTAPERVTSSDVIEDYRRYVRQWSADHVATLSEDGATLRFRKPGTGVYSINFRLEGRYLLVWGDVGDAIYAWSQVLTWGFLAGCDAQYMAGKCQASPEGRHARDWEANVARSRLKEYFAEGENFGIRTSWAEFLGHWDRPPLHDRREWHEWLREHGADLLGGSCWEWAAGVGDVLAHTMVVHHTTLQLALQRCEELQEALVND